MRIVYVEDNAANVLLVKRIARMGNHEILNYIDGDEFLKQFEHDQPDLVLMDLQLAGDKNGLDVVRKLREQGHKTPVVAVTAYAMVGDQERCMEAGCNAYLAKPLPVPDLIRLFEQYQPKPSADVAGEETTTETVQTPVSSEKTSQGKTVTQEADKVPETPQKSSEIEQDNTPSSTV